MKKVILKSLLLLTFVLFFVGCQDDTNLITEINNNDEATVQSINLREPVASTFTRAGIDYNQGGIGVSCTTNPCEGNNVGITDHCQIGQNQSGNRIECTCSGCEMTITMDAYISDIDVWKQISSEEIHFDEFTNYVSEKHGYSINTFNRIDFNFQPQSTSIIYTYELADGTEETLLFLNEYNAIGDPVKKYRIDCVGECGCREIFDFNTNRAECSCDPCTLDVEIIDGQ